MQTVFDFQENIDLTYLASSLHLVSKHWCFSIFRSRYIKSSQSITIKFNQPTHQYTSISKLSFELPYMYNSKCGRKMWDVELLCHIVIDYWASCFWPVMANVYDNHIQGSPNMKLVEFLPKKP